MPTSSHLHISKMIDWVVKIQPMSILDIGIGYGRWGFLCREVTDIWAKNYEPTTWQRRIDGIEAFADYATPTYRYIYSNVYYGDVKDILPGLPNYDLIILGDVIEHFTKEIGQNLLSQLRRKSRYILVSSPTVFFEQEVPGNPFERHRSFWSIEDFSDFEFDYDEYESVFVTLVRGDLATATNIELDGWTSRIIYSQQWLKKHPKVAQLLKGGLRRLPQIR